MSIFRFFRENYKSLIAGEAAGYAASTISLAAGVPIPGLVPTLFVTFAEHVLTSTAELPLSGSKYTKYLIQDPFYINQVYAREDRIYGRLPYTFLADFIPVYAAGRPVTIDIAPDDTPFRLQPPAPPLDATVEEGVRAFKQDRKRTHNSEVIRLNGVTERDDGIEIAIQRAQYDDQMRSNLILDYGRDSGTSLRQSLNEEFDRKLPPVDEPRLANTIGLAALIFFRDNGVLTPYFVPRTREVAVFNYGAWHCTASGAAEWPRYFAETEKDFNAFILDDMYDELREEAGLLPGDIENLVPLALCRELVRAGKPQFFFIGFTKLTYRELTERMHEARNTALPQAEPTETYRQPLFRFPSSAETEREVIAMFEGGGFTSEAAALLHLCLRFIKAQNIS